MLETPKKTPSDPFEKNLRQAAEDTHPRPAFVAELRAALADQQSQRAAHRPRFRWARPLLAQGGLLALLLGLVGLALFLTPQIVPEIRPGQEIEATGTPLPDQPIPVEPNGLPTGALARLGQGQILALDADSSGRLAVGSTLGICVYGAGHMPEWCRPFGLAYNIGWLQFNPAGDTLAVTLSDSSGEGKVVIVDAATGQALAAHPFPSTAPGLSYQDSAIAWDPSGQPRLAIPGESGMLLVWDWQSDQTVWGPLDVRAVTGEADSANPPFSLDWALDAQGQSLLAAGGRNGLLLLDGATGQEKLRLDPTWQVAPVGGISSLDLSEDGGWLAYGYEQGAVALRIEGGQVSGHNQWTLNWQPMKIAIGPKTAGSPLAVQVKEGAQVIPLEGRGEAVTVPAGYSPLAWDARGALYFARTDGMLGIYENGADNIIVSEYSVWPERIAWNGMQEVLSLHGATINHWDTSSGKLGSVSSVFEGNPVLLAVSPDGARAAYYMEGEAAINIWDTANNQAITRLEPAYRSSLAAFTADGARLVSIGPNGQLVVWDAGSGQPLREQVISEMDASPLYSQLDALAVSADGRTAALSWARGSTLHLDVWDLEQGQKLHELPLDSNIIAMAWSPDGRTLAAASGSSVTLWDAGSGQQVRSMGPENYDQATDAIYRDGAITSLVWSPDGQTIATGGGLVTVWNTAEGQLLRAFGGHRGLVSAVAYRPDGLVLASSSVDGTILLWDLGAGGLPIQELQPTATPLGADPAPVEPTPTPLPVDPTPGEPVTTPQPVEPSPTPQLPLLSFDLEQALERAANPVWNSVFFEYQTTSIGPDGIPHSFYKQAWIDQNGSGRVLSSIQIDSAAARGPEVAARILWISSPFSEGGVLRTLNLPSGGESPRFENPAYRVHPIENAGEQMHVFFPALNGLDRAGSPRLLPREAETGGRRAFVIEAGTERYWFDLERNFLLRKESNSEGTQSVTSVRAVAYDVPLPERLGDSIPMDTITFIDPQRVVDMAALFSQESRSPNGLWTARAQTAGTTGEPTYQLIVQGPDGQYYPYTASTRGTEIAWSAMKWWPLAPDSLYWFENTVPNSDCEVTHSTNLRRMDLTTGKVELVEGFGAGWQGRLAFAFDTGRMAYLDGTQLVLRDLPRNGGPAQIGEQRMDFKPVEGETWSVMMLDYLPQEQGVLLAMRSPASPPCGKNPQRQKVILFDPLRGTQLERELPEGLMFRGYETAEYIIAANAQEEMMRVHLRTGAVEPRPKRPGDAASDALWGFLGMLAQGKQDPSKYAQAAALYGGSWEELARLNPEVDPGDHAVLLQRACEVNGYTCRMVQQVSSGEERDGFHMEVLYMEGGRGVFWVKKNAEGRYVVMDLPPLEE